jgi:hypothetical protein
MLIAASCDLHGLALRHKEYSSSCTNFVFLCGKEAAAPSGGWRPHGRRPGRSCRAVTAAGSLERQHLRLALDSSCMGGGGERAAAVSRAGRAAAARKGAARDGGAQGSEPATRKLLGSAAAWLASPQCTASRYIPRGVTEPGAPHCRDAPERWGPGRTTCCVPRSPATGPRWPSACIDCGAPPFRGRPCSPPGTASRRPRRRG